MQEISNMIYAIQEIAFTPTPVKRNNLSSSYLGKAACIFEFAFIVLGIVINPIGFLNESNIEVTFLSST